MVGMRHAEPSAKLGSEQPDHLGIAAGIKHLLPHQRTHNFRTKVLHNVL